MIDPLHPHHPYAAVGSAIPTNATSTSVTDSENSSSIIENTLTDTITSKASVSPSNHCVVSGSTLPLSDVVVLQRLIAEQTRMTAQLDSLVVSVCGLLRVRVAMLRVFRIHTDFSI